LVDPSFAESLLTFFMKERKKERENKSTKDQQQ
jgi:hypothetical protein